jgi:hypothetical protein
MDVTKAPPLDPTINRPGAAAPTSQQSDASPSSRPAAALADKLEIQPLDVAAALQIMAAEIRSALELPAESLLMQSPAQTSRAMIQLFLDAMQEGAPRLPEEMPAAPQGGYAMPENARSLPAWGALSARIELAFQSAMDRAVEAVAAWRDAPQFVVDAAKETRTLIVSQLAEQPVSPLWLRPEWLGLAPKVQRYWRRRRVARRGLTDPDSRPPREADDRDAGNPWGEKPP